MYNKIYLIPVAAGAASYIAKIINCTFTSSGPDHYTQGSEIFVHGPNGRSYSSPDAARQAAEKLLKEKSN